MNLKGPNTGSKNVAVIGNSSWSFGCKLYFLINLQKEFYMILIKMTEPKLYVITGGPGVGKTTLLDALKNKGLVVVPEDARRIIKEQMQANGEGLPWKD